MKKLVIICISLLLLLSSCSRKEEGTIRVALSQEPVTTDVMVNTSLSGRLILVGNVYEKLLVLDQNDDIQPELASSYYLSNDGKKLTFVLRKNVNFHNGKIMTEEDVISSLNRWLSVYGKAKEMVGDAFFEKSGEREVTIESESSLIFLPYLIASSPQSAIIVPSESIKADGLITDRIGSGPYVMKEWRSGEKITLEAFDDYSEYGDEQSGIWGKKKAKNKRIEYYFVSDSVTRLLGLQSGEYHIINDLMSDDRTLVEKSKSLEILEGNESGLIALVFNKKSGVMTNKALRQAASLSFNPDELMKSCYGEYGYSLHSDYMEKGKWSVENDNPFYGQNQEEAKALMTEYKGETVRILTSNLSNMEKIAYAAESELERVGFNVEVSVVDWATLMDKRQNENEWDIFISAFTTVPLPQMKSFLSPIYPGWMEEDSEEYSEYRELDNALNIEDAIVKWEEVQEFLWSYVPSYIPGHYTTSYAKSTKLKGVIVQDGFYLWNAII